MDGYTPVRVSTFPIENIIEEAVIAADAVGFTYSQNGHNFYILTLPTANRTLCYDDTTGGWSERQSGTTLTPARWNVNCIVSAWDKLYVGTTGGDVAILDLDTPTELGEPIRSVAVSPPFYPDGKRASMSLVELEVQLGVGIQEGQGVDPQVMVRFSDDGTKSWSNQRIATLNRTGNATDRAIVRRLGQFRQRSLEFSISDPVTRSFYGIRVEGAAGTS